MSTWKKIVVWSSGKIKVGNEREQKLIPDKKMMFTVDEEAMLQSKTIKNMLEEGCFNNDKIPVLDVNSKTLSKIIDYCTMHAYNNNDHQKLKDWDANFLNVDLNTLIDLMIGANYLCIESLSGLVFQSLANTIRNKLENVRINDQKPVKLDVDSILSKIIEYCTMHAHNNDPNKLQEWDANFVNVDPFTFFDLMIVAYYLCIESLSDLLLQNLANTINEKSLEEICETFKTSEDEELQKD